MNEMRELSNLDVDEIRAELRSYVRCDEAIAVLKRRAEAGEMPPEAYKAEADYPDETIYTDQNPLRKRELRWLCGLLDVDDETVADVMDDDADEPTAENFRTAACRAVEMTRKRYVARHWPQRNDRPFQRHELVALVEALHDRLADSPSMGLGMTKAPSARQTAAERLAEAASDDEAESVPAERFARICEMMTVDLESADTEEDTDDA